MVIPPVISYDHFTPISAYWFNFIAKLKLRNRFYHELGATKLACLWVLERFGKSDVERSGR